MKKSIFTLLSMFLATWGILYAQNDFSEGNLVILSVGKTGEPLAASGNTVYLNEYDTLGKLVQRTELPSTGDNKLILAGTDNYCGYLNRSSDNKYLLLAGFNATPGEVADLGTSNPSDVNRTIAIVDAALNIDLSTRLNDLSLTPRGATSTNGEELWISAPGFVKKNTAIHYTQKGETTIKAAINRRQYEFTNIKTFANNGYNILFGSRTGSGATPGLTSVGAFVTDNDDDNYTRTEIPDILYGTYGNWSGVISQAYGGTDFVLIDQNSSISGLDVGYIGTLESDNGNLIKQTHQINASGSYQSIIRLDGKAFTIPNTDNYNFYGLTQGHVCENSIVLYASCYNSSEGAYQLIKITDKSTELDSDPAGYISIEVLATAPSGTAFRGIALAPEGGRATQGITNFANIEKNYGDGNFKLTAKATSGDDIDYSIQYDSIAYISNDDSVHILQAGTTNITATQTGNGHYKPVESTIILHVSKAIQKFSSSITKDYAKNIYDGDFNLDATLISGLEPLFTSGDESIVTLDGRTVHIEGTGETTIYVSQKGNENWEAFPRDGYDYTISVSVTDISNTGPLVSSKTKMNIVPNPVTNNFLRAEFPEAGDNARICIYSTLGGLVLKQEVPAGNSSIDLCVENLLPGMYVIRYFDNKIKSVGKIIKQ